MNENTNAELHDTAREPHRYFGDVDASATNGVQIDIRARLAVEFIKAGLLARPAELSQTLTWPGAAEVGDGPRTARERNAQLAKETVAFALDLGTEYIEQSAKRGLLKDLPEIAELSSRDRLNLERQVRKQIYTNTVGQRIMSEEADRVARPPPGLARP